MIVGSATGFPSTGAFGIVIDEGLATQEILLIDSRAGTTFTVNASGRGFDGTTAASHANGASVKLAFIAADAEDAAAHRWDTPAAAGDKDASAAAIHHSLETTASTQAVGDVASAGASFKAAPGLHKHAMPSFATVTEIADIASAESAGVSATIPRGDHVHAHPVFATGNLHTDLIPKSVVNAKGDLIVATAASTVTNVARGADDAILMADSAQAAGVKWVSPAVPGNSAVGDTASEGTGDNYARGDHRHGRESFVSPTIALGTAGAVGSSNNVIRSDATIAAFDGTAPTQSARGDAAATGAINFAARRDHTHGREAAAAKDTVATAQSTTSTSFTDLATTGPAVTITTRTQVMVILSAFVHSGAAGNAAYMGVDVSGATTIAAATTDALASEATDDTRFSVVLLLTVTAGSNTFTAKYRGTGGSGASFTDRQLIVIPL